MNAMLLTGVYDLNKNTAPLQLTEIPIPIPSANEILIKVSCCGVCHTELDEIEGRTPPPSYPVIPGHQVIGYIVEKGSNASHYQINDRVGVAWIYSACGVCEFCRMGKENLCSSFRGTGRDANGGYAEYMVVDESFAYLIPGAIADAEAAPLLCAGAIGFRSLQHTAIKNKQTLGLMGFGASGHLVLKLAAYLYPSSKILVFARSAEEREFAISLGAYWAGDTNEVPSIKPHAIIDTTPVWNTVLNALNHLNPGGCLVINAIRKEESDKNILLELNYTNHLWMEKEIRSIANITRTDIIKFLGLAAEIPIKPVIEIYPFHEANKALIDLKNKHIKGAKVLIMNG